MCSIYAVFGTLDAAALTALGLQALQHRGQEGTGITAHDGEDGESFHTHVALGLVGDAFGENGDGERIIERLRGAHAIGHNRYSTHGQKERTPRNLQPLFTESRFGSFAIAHNGNLTNADRLRSELMEGGSSFQTSTDTEVINLLIASSRAETFYDALVEALQRVTGAFSLVVITEDAIMGVVDPSGVRPLVLGEKDGIYFLASETCALDIVNAKFVRDIHPGEIITITAEGVRSSFPFAKSNTYNCIFELVYFLRPDSRAWGRVPHTVRKAIGAALAREHPVEADMVVPIPASGASAALGYSAQIGIPYDPAIIRNHYVGRTFIEPEDAARGLGVRLKHNAVSGVFEGKRVVLVDDSIVRATTAPKIVEMLRRAGAAEVHMRVASPPITGPCFYGIDTPQKDKLVAANNSVEEIRRLLGVDSLGFLSLEGLHHAVGVGDFCDACFSGNYPLPIE